MNKKNSKGFTLIETLVYLGLFSIIMVGVIAASFAIFESNGRSQTKSLLQEEGNFLLAKINYALSSAKSVSVSATNLDITKSDLSHSIFSLPGTILQLGGVNLNNSNVSVGLTPPSTAIFTHSGVGTPVESVTTSFTLTTKTPNGQTYKQNFQTTKYLRK